MPLSTNEVGDIAYKLLKYKMKKDGLKVDDQLKREFGNISQATGIPKDKIEEFAAKLYHELLDEALPRPVKLR